MAEVVVAGHICLDLIPHFLNDSELTPGSLIEVGPADLATGGCVSNVGRALHRLGVRTRLLGKVGDDPFGGIVVDLLRIESEELVDGLVVSPGGATSYSVVINPPGRDRTFLHMPGENDTFSAADVQPEALAGARVLHLGYPPLLARLFADEGAELELLLKNAKQTGILTSLDLSLPDPTSPSGRAPWETILARALPYVDLFFPSDAELEFMLGLRPQEAITQSQLLGASLVVVKCGDKGLIAGSDGRIFPNGQAEHPCFRVEMVGTTGSGDATIAGFLMGFVRGFDLAGCLQAGCAVGAHSIEAFDAVSGIRPWPETLARIAGGWKTSR